MTKIIETKVVSINDWAQNIKSYIGPEPKVDQVSQVRKGST